MNFLPETKIVLSILNHFARLKTPAILETIRTHDFWGQQRKEAQSLVEILNQLIDHGLVSCTGIAYSLTKQGVGQVKQWMSEGFSAMMVASTQSATSQKFCERVYGLDLCQFNMMSQVQLNTLLEVMNFGPADHILDLGCGVGRVTEYISDVTGARVMGIDFAAGAIQLAQERTRNKRVSYQVMDMDKLSLPMKSFSGVIAIDTLHFVNDLNRTLQSVQACLQENGQMGIFYATTLSPGETMDSLKPEQTPLAKVLRECGLNYQTWDFTQDERALWEKILCVAEELRQEYEEEGNLDLYEMSVADARPTLEAVKTGRRSRYLYHIQAPYPPA